MVFSGTFRGVDGVGVVGGGNECVGFVGEVEVANEEGGSVEGGRDNAVDLVDELVFLRCGPMRRDVDVDNDNDEELGDEEVGSAATREDSAVEGVGERGNPFTTDGCEDSAFVASNAVGPRDNV